MIVAAGEDALEFLLRNRGDLFPGVPVVHMGIDGSSLRRLPPLPLDVVGVPMDLHLSATLDQALRWHPQARHVVIVTGASDRDLEWEDVEREAVTRFSNRVTVEFLSGLPPATVLKRLGELDANAVVFTAGYFQDGDGRQLSPQDSVKAMTAVARAPVYGPYDTLLGTGIVGGYMATFEGMGRQAAQLAGRLLDGVAPDSLRVAELTPTAMHVDWRQLRRWGIDQKSISRDAVVHFREPTLLEAYWNETIIGVVVFLFQTALIVGLLVERRRRRVAELAEHSLRFELLHASRLAVMGELTGSIAHEINQPLGAILSNADAADLLLESSQDRRETQRTILADIRRDALRAFEIIRRTRALLEKHEVEQRNFELNEAITDVELVLRSEARRRQVRLEVRPAQTAITLVGDRIQIQQVLLNLLLNAMEAVSEVSEDRRTVVLSAERVVDRIVVAVRDRGHGIAHEHLPKVFDSFFSTKGTGMGLGLSIARTLVVAHGGTIRVESGPGEGAAFFVELPTAAAAGEPSLAGT